MNSNLLIKTTPQQSLDVFVADLLNAIGLARWEERQSSNYVGERYFRSLVLGMELTAAMADDSEFEGYEFWLSFQLEQGCRREIEFLDGLADCVARKLAQQGHEVIRPYDMGRVGRGGMIYRRNSEKGAEPRERVVAEEI